MKNLFHNRKCFLEITTLWVVSVLIVVFFLLRLRVPLSPLYLENCFSDPLHSDSSFVAERLIALNSNASSAKIKRSLKNPYAYFKFTDAQEQFLSKALAVNGNLSLIVRMKILPKPSDYPKRSDSSSFMYGFLYGSDFISSRRLKKVIDKRPLVTGDIASFQTDDSFDVAFSIGSSASTEKNKIPKGFFIFTERPAAIVSVGIQEGLAGWSRTDIPVFAFAPNGGKIDSDLSSFDFTGCSMLFSSVNSKSSIMPHITMNLKSIDSYGTYKKQPQISFAAGGEKIGIRRAQGCNTLNIETAALSNPFGEYSLNKNDSMVLSLMMTQGSVNLIPKETGRILVPYTTDPGLIADWPVKNWRSTDYELFKWQEFPDILYFDTRNYKIQQDFFRRLAFYVEKSGYRGKFLTDEELGDMHGYNAHDYQASDLASFFTKAAKQNFQLNKKELLLRDILTSNDIIISKGSGEYSEGKGAIISISQESSAYLRSKFVAHEGWHGIYFTTPEYRNFAATVYYTMDQTALQFLKTFWITQNGLHYDPTDDFLMKNEFMAYLMQQPVSQIREYFLQMANRGSVQKNEKQLADYIKATDAVAFEDAGMILNDYVFSKWGLAAGRVWLISR